MTTTTTTSTTSPFLLNSVQPAKDYLDDLLKEREDCDKSDESSKDKLYDLLSKCLRLFELMTDASTEATQLRSDFDKYIESAGLKFQRDTHTVNKIAGVVFTAQREKPDRRRASAYGQVLKVALTHDVTSDGLVKFIKANGGADKVRNMASKSTPMSTATKAGNVYASINTVVAATVKVAMSLDDDRAFIDKPVVLLATQRAHSTFVVHGIVKASGAVDTAFATLYPEMVKADADSKTEADVAQQSNELDTARAEVIAGIAA